VKKISIDEPRDTRGNRKFPSTAGRSLSVLPRNGFGAERTRRRPFEVVFRARAPGVFFRKTKNTRTQTNLPKCRFLFARVKTVSRCMDGSSTLSAIHSGAGPKWRSRASDSEGRSAKAGLATRQREYEHEYLAAYRAVRTSGGAGVLHRSAPEFAYAIDFPNAFRLSPVWETRVNGIRHVEMNNANIVCIDMYTHVVYTGGVVTNTVTSTGSPLSVCRITVKQYRDSYSFHDGNSKHTRANFD